MLIKLLKQRRSVAALEFALVAPLILALLFGVYDLSNALITYEEVYSAAHSMAASISNEAVQADGSNALTYTQVQQAESILWAEIPTLRSGQQKGVMSITVSSVVFELLPATTATTTTVTSSGIPVTTTTVIANGPCTPSASVQCNYVPVVVWSVAYMGGHSGLTFDTPTAAQNPFASGSWTTATGSTSTGETLRSCSNMATTSTVIPTSTPIAGVLNQTSANTGSSSDLTNLRTYALSTPAPANPAPPAPMLVVDVQFNYQPLIGLVVGHSLPLWVNAYWPVRSVAVSTTQSYTLNEEFATITPNTTSLTYKLSDYSATGNKTFELFDGNGNLAPINSYCVNTSLYQLYASSPETQPSSSGTGS